MVGQSEACFTVSLNELDLPVDRTASRLASIRTVNGPFEWRPVHFGILRGRCNLDSDLLEVSIEAARDHPLVRSRPIDTAEIGTD